MLPKVALLANYGGALLDYSSVKDSSRDRSATGVNPAFGDIAAMTHTAIRAWARLEPQGTGTPFILSGTTRDELWNNGLNAAPAPSRLSTGKILLTYPSTVLDEIPSEISGSTPAGFPVQFRAAWVNVEPSGATMYGAIAFPVGSNGIQIQTYTVGTSTLVDISDGSVLAVFGV